MSMSLIIIGILASSAFHLYSAYITQKQATKTLEAVSTVSAALYQYKNVNGRFPCPAAIMQPKDGSSLYGVETNCADPKIGTSAVVAPGECLTGTVGPDNLNGICVEQSTRSISGVNPRVRVGSIPFRTLQLDEKDTFDGYGSRLVYAVTESMAVANTFKDTEAAIEIRDARNNVLSGGDKSVAFVVISPGKNRNGSVSIGGAANPCDTSKIDGQNCRDFTSNTNTLAVYTMDVQSAGTDVFDDIVEYFVPTATEVWRRQTPNSENMVDMTEDKVGVGIVSTAQLTDELTVKQSSVRNTGNVNDNKNLSPANSIGSSMQTGGLRVGTFQNNEHRGAIIADEYCDSDDPTKCFRPERIAGTYDGDPVNGNSGMGCPAGEYMIGIENGRAKCSGAIRIACDTGKILNGFTASGEPVCVAPLANCLSTTKDICGETRTIPETPENGTRKITYVKNDACAETTYQCKNNGWIRLSGYDTAAACSYTSTNPPPVPPARLTCSGGYTGQYTQYYKIDCKGQKVATTNTASADCTCVGIVDKVICSGNFGGSQVGTKEKTCTGNVLNNYYSVFKDLQGQTYPSEAALLAGKCSCNKPDTIVFTTKSNFERLPNTPTPPIFQTYNASWPNDKYMCAWGKKSANNATCSYDNVVYNYDSCSCSPGTNWRQTNPDCATPGSPTYDACQKVATPKKIRQIRSGSTCAWIDDTDTSANSPGSCTPKLFALRSSGVTVAPSVPLSSGRGSIPLCGSSCACGQAGMNDFACAESSAATWNFYSASCLETN